MSREDKKKLFVSSVPPVYLGPIALSGRVVAFGLD